MTLEEATDTACQYCIEHNILREFLLKNRSEVRRVLLTEYHAKHQRKLDQRDAKEEGRIEGLKRGELIGKVRVYAYEMHLNPEEIAQKVDADIETIEEILGK
jgi:predicted transposase YdaD